MANLISLPEEMDVDGTSPWEYEPGVTMTLTANALNAPNGTLTAETCNILISGGSNHRQAVTVTASTQYTWSFYCKRGTATALSISVYDITGSADIIAVESYYAETNSSTWSRIQRTFTTPVGCTSIYVYTHRDSASTGTYHVWRGYLNTGASPEEALITETAARVITPITAVVMR
jgi:hypothetical protein